MKPSILFAVGCDPKLAYRIFLEADYLSKTYELEVRGLSFERNFKPTHTQRNNYIVSTLPVKGTLALTKDILKGIPKLSFFLKQKPKSILLIPILLLVCIIIAPFLGLKISKSILINSKSILINLLKQVRLFIFYTVVKLSPLLPSSFKDKHRDKVRNFFEIALFRSRFPQSAATQKLKKRLKPKNPTLFEIGTALKTLMNVLLRSANQLAVFVYNPKKYGVLHIKDLEMLPFATLVKWVTGAKIVYNCYEFYPHSIPNVTGVGCTLLRKFEKILIVFADEIITVTPQMAELISSAYNLKNVHWVPNVDHLPKKLRAKNSKLKKRGDDIKFYFQGNFSDQRGIEELLDAWAKIPQSSAKLYLKGPNNQYRNKYIGIAKQTGTLNKTVFFQPPLMIQKRQSKQAFLGYAFMMYASLLISLNQKTINSQAQEN